jgi:plastocyanin
LRQPLHESVLLEKMWLMRICVAFISAVVLAGCAGGGNGAGGDIVASNTQFSTKRLTFTAGEHISLVFVNEDSFDHNWALYENQADAHAQQNPIAMSEEITAGTVTIDFTAPDEGEYPFQCDLHPSSMVGTAIVTATGG